MRPPPSGPWRETPRSEALRIRDLRRAGHDRGGASPTGWRSIIRRPCGASPFSTSSPPGRSGPASITVSLGYWHWSFLAQPHPIPECLIEPDPEFFLFTAQFRSRKLDFVEPAALEVYRLSALDPRGDRRHVRMLSRRRRLRPLTGRCRQGRRPQDCLSGSGAVGRQRARWAPGATPWPSGVNGLRTCAARPSTAVISDRGRGPGKP